MDFKPKIISVCLISSFLTAGSAYVLVEEPLSYSILKTQGVRAAMSYITSKQSASNEDYYQWAWIDYRNQHFKQAEKKANSLLSNKHTPEKVRADCYYLIGEINSSTGAYDQAFRFFAMAQVGYTKLGRNENLFLNSLGLAKALIGLGEAEQSLTYLTNARSFYEKSPRKEVIELGLWYEVRAKAAFFQGNYEQALSYTRQGVPLFEESGHTSLAYAYSNLGFFLCLNGSLGEGFAFTLRAQERIVETGDRRAHMHNMVNFVLYNRCVGLPYQFMVEKISTWAEQSHDSDLSVYLNISLNHCSESGQEDKTTGTVNL